MEKNDVKKEVRFMPQGLKIREAAEGDDSKTIEGCAIVFDKETTLWDGKYERVREIIASSCVTKEFLAQQDIKLNLLHERENSIGRNKQGQGTLDLDLREDGLYFSFEVPDCDLGRRAYELVKNGTYTGCSFEFYEQDYTQEQTTLPDGREDILITHTQMKSITALTIAMDPAYEQTSVSAREAQKREVERMQSETDRGQEEQKREKLQREVDRLKREAVKSRNRLVRLY